MADSQTLRFNITILGYGNVGKTSMISILNDEHFDEESGLITMAVDYSLKIKKINNKNCIFKIYDTPGVDSQKLSCIKTIRSADGIILLFSVDNRTSFDEINYWLQIINEQSYQDKKIIYLVANKNDLIYRVISNEEGI